MTYISEKHKNVEYTTYITDQEVIDELATLENDDVFDDMSPEIQECLFSNFENVDILHIDIDPDCLIIKHNMKGNPYSDDNDK